jgi:hypothetical protein
VPLLEHPGLVVVVLFVQTPDTISADLQNSNTTYYNEGARAVGLKIKMIINEKEKKDVRISKSALIVSTPHIDIMLSNAILPSFVLKTLL